MLWILGMVIQIIEIVFLVHFVMLLVDPTGNHTVSRRLAPITTPILTPIRAALPASQFDYSALVVVLVLNIVRWVLHI